MGEVTTVGILGLGGNETSLSNNLDPNPRFWSTWHYTVLLGFVLAISLVQIKVAPLWYETFGKGLGILLLRVAVQPLSHLRWILHRPVGLSVPLHVRIGLGSEDLSSHSVPNAISSCGTLSCARGMYIIEAKVKKQN